jgi:signal transduction histidine kinase/ligand-binding sensor domain-containing protein
MCCCFNLNTYGQKYIFSRYNIEDGLIQSQVNKLTQDASHCLWMGTLGGACRFDGHDFTSYSKENGLSNNFVYSVFCDKKNRMWFGTQLGIACLDGKKLFNFPIPSNLKNTWVTNITEDIAGTIWLTIEGKLFKITGNRLQYAPIPGAMGYSVINIVTNPAGDVCASVFQKGIYRLKNNRWTNIIPFTGIYENLPIRKVLFDRFNTGKTYLLAYNKLFVATGGTISAYPNARLNSADVPLLSLAQDNLGNLWVGSQNGAYCLNKDKLTHFDSRNGFSDISVPDIYCDSDNNVWLATWGGGIYKYEGSAYTVFDQSQGLNNFQTVMGVVTDKKKHIYLGCDGAGIVQYDGTKFTTISLPSKNPYTKKVQCIFTDRDDNIWMGTSLGGLWKYDGHSAQLIRGSEGQVTNALTQDTNGTIWLSAPAGCFYYDHNTLKKLAGFNDFSSSLLALGHDTVLIGTQHGIKLAVNKTLVAGFKLPPLASSSIFCMMRYRNKVLIGTADHGLFVWDPQKGTAQNYDVSDGLNANSIYNLVWDKKNTVWAGTGRGLNKVVFNSNVSDCTIFTVGDSKEMIAEANQNAALYADGKVWMGTTKGLAVYNTSADIAPASRPYITIQAVHIIKKQNNKATANANRGGLLLNNNGEVSYDQNHLSISFLGIYLKNPTSISYQYQLTGIDDKFCAPVKNTTVDYTMLPPGNYTFMVKALNANGLLSDNTATFSFTIIPAFYQTWYFKVLLLLSFVLVGIFVQAWLHKRKLRHIRAIEHMKREEKQKIRQQTAEDFHDDMGNKLTRITVLSEILTATISDKETDQKKIVSQIKQNAEDVYNGTKDILWSLDPKSDNLYEILIHIRQFGTELFQDTDVEFEMDEIETGLSSINLPMKYSRNMTMIFKELMNNILKHASASKVTLQWGNIVNKEIEFKLQDNGKGFDLENAISGHGINNVKNRAARLGGEIAITSTMQTGTQVILKLPLKK